MQQTKVTQTIRPSEDSDSPEVVHYIAEGGLGKNAVSLKLVHYPESTSGTATLTFRDNDNKNAIAVRDVLKTGGFASEITASELSHQSRLIVEDVTKASTIPMVATLATLPESQGGIAKNTASQIIDHELKRTGRTASEAGLMTLKAEAVHTRKPGVMVERPDINLGNRPFYLEATISHPLSAVTFMRENAGNIAQTTRIAARDEAAENEIFKTLTLAGIGIAERDTDKLKSQEPMGELLAKAGMAGKKPFIAEGQRDLLVHAAAPEVMKKLSERGLVPVSIAQEIEAKATTLQHGHAVRNARARGGETSR